MGFDYRYISVSKKTDKAIALAYINDHATIETRESGIAAIIGFELDEAITVYLEETGDVPVNNMAEIGYIYINTWEPPGSPYIFISFTAATTIMSLLFLESMSVKKWFIELCKTVNGIALFLDLEDENYKFIYRQDADPATCQEIIREYQKTI